MKYDWREDGTALRLAEIKPPPAKPPIIGLAGKAGAGKDTLAALLVEQHGYTRRAFADAIKEDVAGLLFQKVGATRDAGAVDKVKHIPEVRALLQSYGVAQRSFDADYWVKRLWRYIDTRTYTMRPKGSPVPRFVVPDTRFPNEALMIKRMGGKVVCVVRPGLESELTPEQRAHPSETALDDYADFDAIVLNRSTPQDMLDQLRTIIDLG